MKTKGSTGSDPKAKGRTALGAKVRERKAAAESTPEPKSSGTWSLGNSKPGAMTGGRKGLDARARAGMSSSWRWGRQESETAEKARKPWSLQRTQPKKKTNTEKAVDALEKAERVRKVVRVGSGGCWVLPLLVMLATAAMLLGACAGSGAPAAATPAPTLEPTAVPIVDPVDWPAPTAGTITVDTTIRSGPISPYLFGSNTGPWSGVPFDLKDEAIDARITMLRWPGGEFADRNAFTTVGLDRFIQLCRELGAEPYVHVRLREGTPEAAAEIVRYANVEMGYGIKYWAVGNEPNLYPPDEVYTSEKVSTDWRTLALAMRAVDPSIILMGPEITGYLAPPAGGPFVEEAREMTEYFLRANGDLVDIVTIHRYPFPVTTTSGPPTIDELADNVVEWDTMIADLRRLIIETTGRDLPIGVTEFNSNYSKQHSADTTPDSIASAAWLADVLGRMIVGRVTIGTQFALQSTPTLGAWGLLERSRVRPAYYVYPIYKHFGSELVYAAAGDASGAVGAHPRLTAYAALTETGGLTLLLINRGTEPLTMPLSLRGHAGGPATVYRLDAARAEAGTAADPTEPITLSDGMMLQAPPLSVTLYVTEE